ncbi:hypothetical protein [Streptomyces sp. HPF1205]|uniref:hypothetical protein n=1 Tax=Streptomyces sp. HPF1205 TaxID=2873262 RepID=UPI001CEDDC12|nr:hypothetical protein [Streptomyces sp. HPF1205]
MGHWHAYAWTGGTKPADRDARDMASATPPPLLRDWFRKPRVLLAGTFADADAALEWLGRELAAHPPPPGALPAEVTLAYGRERLRAFPYDLVTRYYTAGGYVCRDLVRCEGEPGVCPGPP